MKEAEEWPDGWMPRRLDEVARVAAGTTAPQGSEYFEGGEFPFVRAQDVGRFGRTNCLTETKDKVNEHAVVAKRLKLARKGAVVFPKSGASILTNSRAKLGVDAYIVSHLAVVTASPIILDDDFLYHWLCTLDMSESAQSDEGYPSLRLSDISAFEIPVPPLPEQRRLVARIEALTSRLEQAREARQVALAEVDTLRQALWDGVFAEVPEELWQPIGTHAKIQGGYAFKSGWFTTSGIRLLRNQNVYHGTLEWSDTVYLPPDRRHEFPTYEMNVGDVVISMDRPLISTGLKAARIRAEDLPCLLLQRVGRFQFKPGLHPDYLFHFLSSQAFMMHISGDGRSSAVPHISAKQIEGIRIPIPSSDEQQRIVERLDALAVKQTELRRLQKETEAELAAFTPALLAKAFRGEL